MKTHWKHGCLFVIAFCLMTGLLGMLSQASRADTASLTSAVSMLPETTPQEKLKKATLQWALEDAQAARAAGQDPQATLADVQQLLSRPIGQRRTSPANLFPNIPVFDKNPIAQSAVATIAKILTANQTYDKNSPVGASATWREPFKIATEGLLLAEGLCHPQSPYVDDPKLIAALFRRFDAIYAIHQPGSKILADFGYSTLMTEMYLLIDTVYPDLILPSKRVFWETALRANSDAIMALEAKTFLESKPGTAYPNSDTRRITALLFAGMIFHNSEYTKAAEGGVRLEKTALYPDGGFAYIGEQNEAYTYHAISVIAMARYWQVTGNTLARQIAENTRLFYPLSIEPSGVAEYSTVPSWKHYWNQSTGSDGALVVANLTGDAQNMRVAQMSKISGDFVLASFYRDDIKPGLAPDNYIVYDRNIQGPRGRFGRFSFSGTSRAYPNETRGKSTFVGCVALDASGTWPLNAALQDASVAVYLGPKSRQSGSGFVGASQKADGYNGLAQKEKNAATVAADFAALTTTYRLSSYEGSAIEWAGRQEWIYTPQRMVGLVTLESLQDQDAFGMEGSLMLVSGRQTWGTRKEFEHPAPDTWKYGAVLTQIHAQDFGSIETEYTDVFSGDVKKAGRIVLVDSQSHAVGSASSVHYPQKDQHFYLVEVRPEWSKPADNIMRLTFTNGLVGFQLQEDGHQFQLVHNPTDSPLTYVTTLNWGTNPILLHRSGEQYRPAWIGRDGKAEHSGGPETLTQINGQVTISIPAGAHIVLTNQSSRL